MIGTMAWRDKLHAFSSAAVARLVEHAARMSGDSA